VSERLCDLHAAGYVHRDIKPANIMWLPRKKRWTLIDFGCAAKAHTMASNSFTPAFAAPEAITAYQMETKAIRVTEALDAWSLGVLALELFTGKPAFPVFQSKSKVCTLARI
jgi:eukaryotic-like serine/threonine-protein kinase